MHKSDIQANLEIVQEEIRKALITSERSLESVKLIAVSKLQPPEAIAIVVSLGVLRFGENYPEETDRKLGFLQNLPSGIEWHMIGHIQSRKIHFIHEYFSWVHSVDSCHVAEGLSTSYKSSGSSIPVLLEMNLTGEVSKSGFPAWNEITLEAMYKDVERIRFLPGIRIKGLMTMPPLSENPEKSRIVYQKLKNLQTRLRQIFPEVDWEELSMGTSFDYQVAIEEGATMIRIGQAIFGPRPKD